MKKKSCSMLVPPYSDFKLDTEEDVLFLGRRNILALAGTWEYYLNNALSQAQSNRKHVAILRGGTAAYFRNRAKEFENPKDIVKGPCDSWQNELEPIDVMSREREAGTTTFNICGWCKYAGCGTCRYGYHITSHCRLSEGDGKLDVERKFDTPCWLLSATDADISRCVARFEVEYRSICAKVRKLRSHTQRLKKLAGRAEDKPAAPGERPHDWFNIDDPVVCYVGDWTDNRVHGPAGASYAFAPATVIDGYRHHDGCVSVRYTDKIHTGEYLDGHGGGYGMSRPEILHKWEFDYLVAHPEFAAVWLRQGAPKDLKGFSADNMLAALAAHASASKK